MPLLRPILSLSLCFQLTVLPAASARAAEQPANPLTTSTANTSVSPEQDPQLQRAKSLYNDGKAKFETAEYEEALRLWKEAYGLLPDNDQTRGVRHALVYNISEAEIQAYEVSRNVAHLRKAKILLEDYLAAHTSLHGDSSEAVRERSDARVRLKEVKTMLAKVDTGAATNAPATGSETNTDERAASQSEPPDPNAPIIPDGELSPQEQKIQAKLARMREIKSTPNLQHKDRKFTRMITAGSIAIGAGTIFGLVAALGASSAQNGQNSTNVNEAAGIAGLLFLAGVGTGIPLVVVGKKRRNQLRTPIAGIVTPILSPDFTGASAHVRF